MARLLISYRRDDTEAITGRLFDRLAAAFGRESVFRDVDSIAAGSDFRVQVEEAVRRCDVMLAVIGGRWRGHAKAGRVRIEEETDPVRIEIEIALREGIAIIPVLVGAAKMPSPAHLPPSLERLAFRHGCRIDPGEDFDHHVDRLIREIGLKAASGRCAAKAAAEPACTAPPRREPIAIGGSQPVDGREFAPAAAGGYARSSVSHYPGTYLVLRPTFKIPGNVYAYLADISWDDIDGGLVFREKSRPDARHTQHGWIWIPSPSSHLYLVSGKDGWLRSVTLSHLDDASEMRGIISTLHNVGGARYAPAAAPIVFQKRDGLDGEGLGEITPADPSHAAYRAILERALAGGDAQLVSGGPTG